MVLLGTIVNVVFIMIGSMIGLFLSKISDSMKDTIIKGIGITVIVLGIQMGTKSENFLIVISSIIIGGIIGEKIDLDGKLTQLGRWLESRFQAKGQSVAEGFVTSTLIFVVGAMAVIGALDSGIRGDHQVLYTKAMLDGFTAIILTTSLGIGVFFSWIPVFIYQGTITLLATQIEYWIPKALFDSFLIELTATGGIMIFAIGLSLTGILKIKVANFLPSLIVLALIIPLIHYFPL
ncbi:DUF554 domain-containing protein [Fervidibacillus halotolerans]|uniref:DUF554 domain-containing protein n=1 Tax=Fervidibacillus halotolerans TaxID=2980027 RepID=A0A9E8S057_9BACI|nr:DUF554 domain-containing protein [Fervidibacillus halotolerans]WAA12287.1 DUF554 domain-containing protein [Fervidibacillus halotolerans]